MAGAPAIGCGCTLEPACNLSWPSVTTCSPGDSPELTAIRFPSVTPVVTLPNLRGIVLPDDEDEGSLHAALNGRRRNDHRVLLHIEQETSIHELIRPE